MDAAGGGSVERGIGCAAVFPGGMVGFAVLMTHPNPGGWVSVAELIGWMVACVAAGIGVAALLGRWRRGLWGAAAVAASIGAVAAFTYAPWWLGMYAPGWAKLAFTTSLLAAGSLAAAGTLLCFFYLVWSDWRGS